MAITKVINDAVDLNQTSDYSGLRLPVGTTGNVVESFTTDYLIAAVSYTHLTLPTKLAV